MTRKQIGLEDVLSYIETLPYARFKSVVEYYSQKQSSDFSNTLNKLVVSNFEQRLEMLEVNKSCPSCTSDAVVKNGKRKNIQQFKCKDCHKRFNRFTDTILEKTRWHWDIWVKVLEMVITQYPIHDMMNLLINDYSCIRIDYKTLWFWRMKLIHALAKMPTPNLTDVIQVDETFIRESQKGSRKLVSTINKNTYRKPQYGRQPSQLGVMDS